MGLFRSVALPVGRNRPLKKVSRTSARFEALEQRTLMTGVNEFTGLSVGAIPENIVAGPDGALWFTEGNNGKIGRITNTGQVTEFSVSANAGLVGIAAGTDGALYFTEFNASKVGRITTSGAITEFTTSARPYGITANSSGVWFTERDAQKIGFLAYGAAAGSATVDFSAAPGGGSISNTLLFITTGPDGNVYFSEVGTSDKIGKMNVGNHAVTEFGAAAGITQGSGPQYLTTGSDHNIWFTESNGTRGAVASLNLSTGLVTEFGLASGSTPLGITSAGDGELWFVEQSRNMIGRISTSGSLNEFAVPTAGAAVQGIVFNPTSTGGDGNVWFTESNVAKIGQATLVTLDRNQKYVTQLYNDLLGHAPDATGLAFWSGELDAGMSFHDVSAAIVNSNEYLGTVVDALYVRYLNRHAEAVGLNFWIGYLQGGHNTNQLLAALLGSDEYFHDQGSTPDGFINALYQSFLHRSPSGSELSGQEVNLAASSRSALAVGFADSPENLNLLVNGLYTTYLHRQPDSAGLTLWTGLLASGVSQPTIVAFFTSVPEYLTLHNI